MHGHKAPLIYIGIAAVAALLVAYHTFEPRLYQMGDNGGYIALGISFARGYGFSHAGLCGNPHYLWWPPGLPLVIAGFYKLMGPQWLVLKIIIYTGLFAAMTAFSVTIYRKERSGFAGIAILLGICFSPSIHLVSSALYSEPLYLIVSLLFFVIWYRWKERLSPAKFIILSIWALAVATIRNVGMSLPVAFIVAVAWRFRRAPYRIPRLAWIVPFLFLSMYALAVYRVPALRVQSFHSFFRKAPLLKRSVPPKTARAVPDGTVSKAVRQRPERRIIHAGKIRPLIRSLQGYGLTLIPRSVLTTAYDSIRMNRWKACAAAFVTLLIATGWIGACRQYPLMNIYTFIYGVTLFAYGPLYVRLLVPIVPMLVLYLYRGIRIAACLIPDRRACAVVTAGLWLCVIVDSAWGSLVDDPHKTMPSPIGTPQYRACLQWIVEHAEPDAVVVSKTFDYLFIKRGRYSIPFHYSAVPNHLLKFFDEYRVQYIVVGKWHLPRSPRQVHALLHVFNAYPGRFKKIYGSEEAWILRYTGRDRCATGTFSARK